ncbi:MAG: LCP family protein [Ruminococcus sp.]|nr:LCP family protein [Ruminococcus sp.]
MAGKDGRRNSDPYAAQYEEQLRQFSRLAGDDGGETDLTMHSIDEAFDGRSYGTYSQERHHPQDGGYHREEPYPRSRSPKSPQGHAAAPPQRQPRPAPQPAPGPVRRPRRPEPARSSKANERQKRQRKMETNERKKKGPLRRFFRTVLILVLVVFLAANGLLIRYIMMVDIREDRWRTYTSGALDSKKVSNILIIGSDTRDPEDYGRTDSMILLSVNSKTREITMTSFMRDMYLEIAGQDHDGYSVSYYDKLNSAYVTGGPELLMDTLEYDFDISIDDYVYIDFFSFIEIVDAVGGIELTVTDAEAEGMIPPMAEQNHILGYEHGKDYLSSGGTYNMNGNQALAYARLRYVGNADFQRTERQREVISKVIAKVRHSDPIVIDRFARAGLSHLTTNMSRGEMFIAAYKALFSMDYKMKSLRIPAEDHYDYGWHDGQSTLDIDLDYARALLKAEIYGE